MATRIAATNGNFTTAGTWDVADATSLLVSSVSNTALTTSYVTSSTFTPGAITIDGIAVWVFSRAASPSGTISVALDQATVTVAGTEVTINVADIPAGGNCWVLFKFAAPVTLLGATAYSVKAKTSVGAQVNLNRDGTANNWSRLLRTTTTGAPAAADPLYILGEKTGAGTGNIITVTMNDAAGGATVYGQIDISAGGVLTYGVAAATAYYLKIAGDMNVRAGGTLKMGDVGSAMPANSSGVLEFNCGSNVQYGLLRKNGGTLIGRGNPITVKAKLAADVSGGATSMTTDVSTGWKNGDEIGIPSTTRTFSQAEKKSLTADAVGTTLTIAALANAHGGNASTGVQADLINLTRNVKIRGISTSLQAYIKLDDGGASDMQYVEMYQLGSANAGQRGIDLDNYTSGVTESFQFCSWHDFIVAGSGCLFFQTASGTINSTIDFNHNVSYLMNQYHYLVTDRTMGTGSVSIRDHIAIKSNDDNISPVQFNVAEMTVDGFVGASLTGFFVGSAIAINFGGGIIGTFKNITTYGCNTSGVQLWNGYAGNTTDVGGFTCWRNAGAFGSGPGMFFGATNNILVGVHITGTNTFFGNATAGIELDGNLIDCSVSGIVDNAGTTLVQQAGIDVVSTSGGVQCNYTRFYVYNSNFGASQTFANGDIRLPALGSGIKFWDITFVNCLFASPTELQLDSAIPRGSSFRYQRRDQTPQLNKTLALEGTISLDTVIFDVTPSVRMAPAIAGVKLVLPIKRRALANGAIATISVKVRCSVIGDGAAYNGNRPRLIQLANPGAGSATDVVLATATGASDGAFQTLTGVCAAVTDDCVLTFVVDCDGTAGWVNVDTVTLS